MRLRRVAPLTLSRRLWLAGAAAIGLGLSLSARSRQPRAGEAAEPIAQPPDAAPRTLMDRALEMRRRAQDAGDQSFGAVIAREGRIVGQAASAVVTRNDPTAHAEMEAIRDAAQRLGRRDLTGCTLYSSSRPCPMCEAAAYWAGIERLIHGAELTDLGAPRLTRC